MKTFFALLLCLSGTLCSPVNVYCKPGPDSAKTVIHTVAFQFNTATTTAQVDQLTRHIRDLKEKIPGILTITCGGNFSERSQGFTYAVTIKLRNTSALQAFYKHPVHLELINKDIKPILKNLLVLDYVDDAD